ncbi:hypothetical protein YC2023_018244 [Brassica napus]
MESLKTKRNHFQKIHQIYPIDISIYFNLFVFPKFKNETYVLLLIRGIKLGHVLNHYFLHFHVFASIYPFSSSSNRQMLLQQSIDSHITQICSLRIESALGCRQRLYEGEAAMDQEDKMVVPPRKEPEVEKKQKPEHEPESEFEKKRRNYSTIELDGEDISLSQIVLMLIGDDKEHKGGYQKLGKENTKRRVPSGSGADKYWLSGDLCWIEFAQLVSTKEY